MLSFLRNKMTKGEDGKMSKLICTFSTKIVQTSDVAKATNESFADYGERMDRMVQEIDDGLTDWDGRGEHLENEPQAGTDYHTDVTRIGGVAGLINMGYDLVMRQLVGPKPLSKSKVLEINRSKAIEYGFTLFLDGKIEKAVYANGMKNVTKFADELLKQYASEIPELLEV